MRASTNIYKICKAVRDARRPVNHNYILGILELTSPTVNGDSIDVVMHQNKQYFNKEHMDCCECGKKTAYFTLTDLALIALAEAERVLIPPSAQEWEELDIRVREHAN